MQTSLPDRGADTDSSPWPSLAESAGVGTKGTHPAPPRPSQGAAPKKNTLPSTLPTASEINADNALRVFRELVAWADARKTAAGGPPQWWLELSPRLVACAAAIEKETRVHATCPSTAADHVKGGGSPLDSGSALAAAGSLLDCGSADLAKIMERLNAQHVEVMNAISGLSKSPLPACDQTAPSRTPAPPARPGAQISAPPQAPSLSLAVSITDLDANSPLRKQTPSDLKCAIESHLLASNIPHLSITPIHSVRRDRTRLHVHAINLAQKNALVKNTGEWLTRMDPKATIVVRKVHLQADLVNTKFDPTSASAVTALAAANPTVITNPDDILSVRWLHDSKRGKTPLNSSLVLTVSNADLARDLIHHGICILGENSTVHVQPPTAQQCYRCQGFGHTSTTCRNLPHARPLSCARCASHDHSTSQCECPAATKCTDMRTCTHVTIRCVNCGGAHKAFASVCPIKANELAKALSSLTYVSLVNELTAAPQKSGAHRA